MLRFLLSFRVFDSTHLGNRTGLIRVVRGLRIAGLLLAGGLLAACSDSDARLLFASNRSGLLDLYSVGVNFATYTSTTDTPSRLLGFSTVESFSVSPEGDRLAFGNGKGAIYTVRLDTTALTKIVGDLREGVKPRWSPAGDRIAFMSEGEEAIFTIRPDGTGRTRVADNAKGPAWSPSGDRIAFVSKQDEHIYTARPDGAGRTQVTSGTDREEYSHLAWSPDGGRIAFAAAEETIYKNIYTIRPDGTGLQKAMRSTTDQEVQIGEGRRLVWAPDGRRLAFVTENIAEESQHSDLYKIQTVRPDGTELTEVLSGDGSSHDYEHLAWSSDGARIAFRTGINICTVRPDGTGYTKVVEGTKPAWTPDGSRIVFLSGREENRRLYTIRPDGTERRSLWNVRNMMPALSRYSPLTSLYRPYGPKMAFVSDRTGNWDIYLQALEGFALETSSPTRVTSSPALDIQPTWSPNRPRLAFTSQRDGNANIYTIRIDGSDPVQITDHSAADAEPAWSPGGPFTFTSTIAFMSKREGNYDIYTISPRDGGAELTQVTDHSARDADPTWSPDGDRIAFASNRSETSQVYTIAPDGTDLTQVTEGRTPYYDPVWAPYGSRIAVTSALETSDGGSKPHIAITKTTSSWRTSSVIKSHRAGNSHPTWGLTNLNRYLWSIRRSALP